MESGEQRAQAPEVVDPPAHLIPLAESQWALWRWVALRSTGFSHAYLQPLVATSCVAAAADYLALEEQGQVTPAVRAAFELTYQEAIRQNLSALHQIASAPAFREALIWQNRRALHTAIDPFLARSPELAVRTSKYRLKEAMVTSYAQRYCTKNDTIGFYGPLGWAWCTDQAPPLTMRHGPGLLTKRTIYFEGWGMDTLAAHLAGMEAIEPWLIPRLLPHLWLDGDRLHIPLASTITLPPDQAAVLAACDGVHCARQIACDLVPQQIAGLQDERAVFAVLRDLRTRRRIAWTMEISIEGSHPEERLRTRLLLLPDQQLRTRAIGALDALEADRQALGEARGDPVRLDLAMEHLETTFATLTGQAATRYAGATFAGRTLVYEDCLRDVQVQIGPALINELGPPLSLLLTSARWLTCEAAAVLEPALQQIYRELRTRTQKAAVPFSDFWLYAHPLLFDRRVPLLSTVRAHFQQRWQEILRPDREQKRLNYRVSALQEAVEQAFAVERPGWRGAHYHSPDVMLAAPSLEHLQRGDYTFVMGELHVGGNTLRADIFVSQHPSPEELHRAFAADSLEALVLPVYSRENHGMTARINNVFVRPHDWRLLFAGDSCQVPVGQALPVGSLEVEQRDGRLLVLTRDRSQQWELIDLLGDPLMIQIVQLFHLFAASGHLPRVSFDRLVVQRETWCFPHQEISFAPLSSESERFLQAHRWLRRHQLPSRVFLKVPTEKKPFYVDFESLASIDVCARILRRIPEGEQGMVIVSEMLPDLHETWLVDQQQRPYTSELRFVAVDRRVC